MHLIQFQPETKNAKCKIKFPCGYQWKRIDKSEKLKGTSCHGRFFSYDLSLNSMEILSDLGPPLLAKLWIFLYLNITMILSSSFSSSSSDATLFPALNLVSTNLAISSAGLFWRTLMKVSKDSCENKILVESCQFYASYAKFSSTYVNFRVARRLGSNGLKKLFAWRGKL